MQRLHAIVLMDMGMQHCNIAVSDYPLRALQEPGKVKPVDDPDGAITSAGTDDRTNGNIVEHQLKIRPPLFIGAGELVIGGIEVIALNNFQSPGSEYIDGCFNFSRGDFPGWFLRAGWFPRRKEP